MVAFSNRLESNAMAKYVDEEAANSAREHKQEDSIKTKAILTIGILQ